VDGCLQRVNLTEFSFNLRGQTAAWGIDIRVRNGTRKRVAGALNVVCVPWQDTMQF
jgi:hypothetical protein